MLKTHTLQKILDILKIDNSSAFQIYLKQCKPTEHMTFPHFNLLHLATQYNAYQCAQLLLEAGFHPDYPVQYAMTSPDKKYLSQSMHLAFKQLEQPCHDIETLGNASAVHIAVKQNHFPMLALLLDHQANPNIQDQGQCSPLHWAVAKRHMEMIEILLRYHADPNLPDYIGSTPLHEACRRIHLPSIQILLTYHADPNLTDQFGDSAMTISKNHADSHRMIVDYCQSKYRVH